MSFHNPIRKYYDPTTGYSGPSTGMMIGKAGATIGMGALAGGPWGAVIAAIPALFTLGKGIVDKKKAEKAAKANVEPTYSGTQAAQNRLRFMARQAMYGLSPSSLAWAQESTNAALTRSLADMLHAGGDPNLVAELYAAHADNTLKTTALDSETQWAKVNVVHGAMREVEAEQEKNYLREERTWANDAESYARKANAGDTMIGAGVDSLFGNTAKLLNQNYAAKNEQNWMTELYKIMYGKGTTGGTTGGSTGAGANLRGYQPGYIPNSLIDMDPFRKPWQPTASATTAMQTNALPPNYAALLQKAYMEATDNWGNIFGLENQAGKY